MGNDGTRLVEQLCHLENVRVRHGDGDIYLTHLDTNTEYRITRTGTRRYLVHKTRSDGRQPGVSFPMDRFSRGALESNVRSQLAGMGLETRAKHLQNKKAKQQKGRHSFAKRTVPHDNDSTPEVIMTNTSTTADPIDQIISDMAFATELLMEAVCQRARAQGAPPIEEDGVTYRDWQGDLYDVIRAEWPVEAGHELPEEPTGEQMQKLFFELQPYMRRVGKALRYIDPESNIWRVRDDAPDGAAPSPVKAPEDTAPLPTPSPPATATPQAATKKKEEGSDMKLYRCEEHGSGCQFADASSSAVVMHQNKSRGRPHPTEGFPCPEPGCLSVRSGVYGYHKHLKDAHADKYADKATMCHKPDCLLWFDTSQEYRTHLSTEHPFTRRPRADAQRTPKAPENDHEAFPGSVTAPEPVGGAVFPAATLASSATAGEPSRQEEIQMEAIRMLAEYPALTREVEELRKEVIDLRIKVRESDRVLKRFQNQLTSLLGGK